MTTCQQLRTSPRPISLSITSWGRSWARLSCTAASCHAWPRPPGSGRGWSMRPAACSPRLTGGVTHSSHRSAAVLRNCLAGCVDNSVSAAALVSVWLASRSLGFGDRHNLAYYSSSSSSSKGVQELLPIPPTVIRPGLAACNRCDRCLAGAPL